VVGSLYHTAEEKYHTPMPVQVLWGNGGVCPHGVCPSAGVLVVCKLCRSGRWCLGGTLGGVSVSPDGVGWCSGSCSCFRGVSVVSWWCSSVPVVFWYWRNIFFEPKRLTCQYQIAKLASREMRNSALGIVCCMNLFVCFFVFLCLFVFCVLVWFALLLRFVLCCLFLLV
jgi:hypothetical protein